MKTLKKIVEKLSKEGAFTMNNINNFINLNDNTLFSELKKNDLQELLLQIQKSYLTYRDKINIPDFLTFGIEIEYEGIISKFVNNFINKKHPNWDSRKDMSLFIGGEIVSSPLTDNINTWKELKEICTYLKKRNAITSKNAGGHIHIGAQIFENDITKWQYFIKTYVVYESIIFRFCYGDKINGRKKILKYASPCGYTLYRRLYILNEAKKITELVNFFPSDKYLALNFSNVHFMKSWHFSKNTIEFRTPNATDEEVIWQNNINMFAKLILSSIMKEIDIDFINYKIDNIDPESFNQKYLYNEIQLQNALEFADLIFDNNLDKIYFLKQYLKDFQNNYGSNTVIKAKRLIK